MFGLFKKDPRKKLQKQYESKLEEAMHSQRNGDMKTFSRLSAEAEEIGKQIEALDAQSQ